MKKNTESGLSLLELVLGLGIGSVAILGSLTLFKMVYKTESTFKNIGELDSLVAHLGSHMMKGTSGIQTSYLDPDYTFYDIVASEDINSKLVIPGVTNMNIFRVADSFYSPNIPAPLTDPNELWDVNTKPIRATPEYFRNSFTLQYSNKVGQKQIIATRCIETTDIDRAFTSDEVIDLTNVPYIYKVPHVGAGETTYVKCCPIDADFPNCADNDLLPRIFHINSFGTVKMFPEKKHLKFAYDAAFGLYMKSAYNPEHFYLRFNVNVDECASRTLLGQSLSNCNKKKTHKFIELKRDIRSSNLSGGVI